MKINKIYFNNFYQFLIALILLVFSYSTAISDSIGIEKIQQELILAKDDTIRAKLLNDAAFILRSSNPKLSLKYANNAMELSVKATYKTGILNASLVKGIIYKHFGDYETAMLNYLIALKISETIGDKSRISSCYNNMGSIYQAQNNYSKAIFYFKKSLDIEKGLDKKDQVSIRLYNIGTIYESINKLDSAFECYKQSLDIEESLKNDEGISFALYGLGGIFTKKAEYSKAETYLKKAYNLAEKNNNNADISYCLNELGVLYMKWKKSDLAISYFLKSISYSDSLQEKNQTKESCHNLALTYADLGKYKEAYNYFLKFNTLNEEINNSDISRKIAEINAKYEVDKIDKEVELMKKEAKIEELKYNQQKNLRNYLLLTSIIVIVLSFFKFSNKKDISKTKKIKISENLLHNKIAWAVLLCVYSIIYTILIQPLGLALLDWADKLLVIAVYGAITLAMIIVSFYIAGIWKEYFRKQSFIFKYLFIALINIILLSITLFLYNSLQGLSLLNFSSFADVLLQVTIISILPIIVLILFAERITYAQNLKDIPLEFIAQQQTQIIEQPKEIQQLQEDKTEIPEIENKHIIFEINHAGEKLELLQSQIICFEANDNYTAIFYLANNKLKKELYRISLKKLEVHLIEYKEIIRCHKSYIINITHLNHISGNAQGFRMHLNYIDFEIPVSRSFPRQIIDDLKEFTSKKE